MNLMTLVLVASLIVFLTGILFASWVLYFSPRQKWAALRPTFIDWVVLAVKNDRMAVYEVERITQMATSTVLGPPRRVLR